MNKIHTYFVMLISLSLLAHRVCTAGETPAPGGDCGHTPVENPPLCMDAACAARAKAELDRTLACHKTKMAELAASAGMPMQVGVGGNK